MADEDNAVPEQQLTPEELDQALAILRERGVQNVCELCHKPTLTLNPLLVTPMPVRYTDGKPGTMLGGGKIMPSIVLLCTNCGNIKFLNSLVLGIRKKPDGTPDAT